MSSGVLMPAQENDPIRKFQAEVQETMEQAERLRPMVKACQEAIDRASAKASINISNRKRFKPKVEILLTCESLDETVPLFRELAKEGLRTDKKDSHQDHNFLEVFAMREYNLGPDVTVIAVLINGKNKDGDGPKCRMEQVGVKEVPVYEMKCD